MLSLPSSPAQPHDEEPVGAVAVRQRLQDLLGYELVVLVQEPIDHVLADTLDQCIRCLVSNSCIDKTGYTDRKSKKKYFFKEFHKIPFTIN